jgi:hypothetical protein
MIVKAAMLVASTAAVDLTIFFFPWALRHGVRQLSSRPSVDDG